ncbi:MAG TPA: phasin family protein [Xanthobacteraceae bacterium]|jgi:phasin family protein
MVNNLEHLQKLSKENAEATVASLGAVSKGFQKIAVELADYSKRVFDEGTAAAEKLLGAKSLDKAIEVQSDYVKGAYEGFVSESTKLGELYAGLAQEAYKPFESVIAKATTER